ncbi:hypothetical protein [Streptomyces sp. NPDC001450]
MPLALAALFSLGWVLAGRWAPPVEPLPTTAPPQERIPGKLGAVRRDWGFFVAACLTVRAPCAAGCVAVAAAGDDDPFLYALYVVVSWLFGVVLSLYALALLKNQLGPGQRMLREDAAAGSVHAVRVRFATPVREAYRYPTGDGVGRIATSSTYCIELVHENEAGRRRTIRLRAMSGHNFRISVGNKHLAHAAARLVGRTGTCRRHTPHSCASRRPARSSPSRSCWVSSRTGPACCRPCSRGPWGSSRG